MPSINLTAFILASVWLTAAADNSQCRLYLGPSSTSTTDEPKLGLYAGVDYEEDDIIGNPEIGIPLIDFTEKWNRPDDLSNAIMEFLEGFLWTGEYGGSHWEGNHTVTLAVPGFGVLANYHSGTHNVDWVQGSVLFREPGSEFVPGKSHPARGAITPYYNFTMRAIQTIPKGMELFANFGDVWDGNATKDIYGDKLTRVDYRDADKVLDKILDFMNKYESKLTPKLKDDVLDFILGKILGTAAGTHAKVVRSLIPAHPGKLQTVKDMGGTFAYRNPDLVKTQKWLDKYATCVDNLVAKVSTIPEAGRGAFATRDLKKGQIIAPVPLLHIAKDDVTFMFDIIVETLQDGGVTAAYDMDKPRGQQLLINYCFAHPESSMILFPTSPMVALVNHANPEKANARLTWSKNKHWGNSFDSQDMTPAELADYHHVSLTMELYALRDIAEGEEVFIDYGRDWEEAWNTHMANYKNTDWPLRAEDLRVEYKTKPFKTTKELEQDPYPAGIVTACIVQTMEMEDGKRKVNDEGNEITLFEGPVEFKKFTGGGMHHCEIIDRQESGDHFYNYTIIEQRSEGVIQVERVPHAAITFANLPYTSDIHHKDAFRHPVGVPDVIFPQAWRDRRD